MKERLRKVVTDSLLQQFRLTPEELPDFSMEAPNQSMHGDFATNAAMVLARVLKRPPRDIAQSLFEPLSSEEFVERIEIAGPGFINFFIKPRAWHAVLADIAMKGKQFGRMTTPDPEKVLVEFVSANPTGPLHFGHGRGAVVGDVLANLLEAIGHQVTREYYVNDAGVQVRNLALSVIYHLDYQRGAQVEFPKDGYQGEYVKDLAKRLSSELINFLPGRATEEAIQAIQDVAVNSMLDDIQKVLDDSGIHMQRFTSERKLIQSGRVGEMFSELEARGVLSERDGAKWFLSDRFGDEKPRVLVKSDGSRTYFATDIAYHLDKIRRGYARLINIWGADHDGYIPRMKASLQALEHPPEALEIILVQMVSLLRDGKPVIMSKRAGKITSLQEVVEEVGRDAARFFFLLRSTDSQMEFDLELAKKRSLDNPVYYVQYGHARLTSILARAVERGIQVPRMENAQQVDLDPLCLPDELQLIKKMEAFKDTVFNAAMVRSPHYLVYYLQELVADFHRYYTRYSRTSPILGSDTQQVAARLILVQALRQVLRNALGLLGISAPDRMDSPAEGKNVENA